MQTSSANAGFITGTYVVFVPLICWLLFQETLRRAVVVGVTLAFAGLSLLSFPTSAPTNLGDLWVLASALSFAAHTVLIGRIGRKSDPLQLAFGQYLFSFLGCALIATLVESSRGIHLEAAIGPFIYLGVVSTAFGYTLQVVGQRFVSSTAAGIILSLESVFAALGGFLLLGESLSLQAKIGCGLLLAGAIVSQTPTKVSPPFSSIREAKSAENAGA